MSKDPTSMLSFILGNDSFMVSKQKKNIEKVNRKLIMSSAMFWDSKKRVQKIKTLFLNSIGLKEFDDTDDFKIFELESIELLSLSKNQLIHLQPISQLTTLVSLNVSFNKIYDLNPLAKLQKLQELYASNNEIKAVEALKQLKTLKIVQLYKNKINNFKQTFETVSCLGQLAELDFGQNPIAQDNQFVGVVSASFPQIKKLNNELNKSTQKIKQMSSSKGFMSTSTKGFGTSSMFFAGNSSVMGSNTVDAQKTFYNFCKKKSLNGTLYQKRREKENILEKLEDHYKQLDEEFEKEIVKNVRLKNRLYKMMESKRMMESEKEDNSAKAEETKLLKRKVKALKEQLFSKDKKGELLRKLFEVEMMAKGKQANGQKQENNLKSQQQQSQPQKLQQALNQIRWTRRFEADEVIVIEGNDRFLGEEGEIGELLGSIDESIREIKNDIDYLS